MSKIVKAYISLGSNLGNPYKNLSKVIKLIRLVNCIVIDGISPVYITEPQGNKKLPWFYNQVISVIVCGMHPMQLLKSLLEIEMIMGRKRIVNSSDVYTSRIIDLDILLFGKEVHNNEKLVIPHPRMLERAFTLIPLKNIEPKVWIPGGGTLNEALKKLKYCVKGNVIYQ